MPQSQERIYTVEDIYALPNGTRAELIDGQIYYMAPPSRKHQKILLSLSRVISDYIDKNNGACEVDIAPFSVFLNEKDVYKRQVSAMPCRKCFPDFLVTFS